MMATQIQTRDILLKLLIPSKKKAEIEQDILL